MSMLSRVMAPAAASEQWDMTGRAPGWAADTFGGRRVTSGVRVNEATAMNYSACWAATRLLTETIATLPRVMYRQQERQKVPAVGHPTYRVFRTEPNGWQSAVTHLSQQFAFLINWGNAYAMIDRDGTGRVVRLWPIHPNRMADIKRDEQTQRLVYYVRNDSGPPSKIEQAEMFHVTGVLSENGVTGKGVIAHAAESIGMGIATEQFGGSLFGNGAGPAMVMTHPKTLGAEAADNLRRSWNKRYSGPDRGNGVLVLEEGTTVTPLTFPPEQAQFLQTRQFNITEIARWYNLPPHLLRELSKSSFSNIESESLHFVLISVLPWLVRWEEECNRQLLIEDEKGFYFFKFLLMGLLRGDMAARAAFYKQMHDMGVYSVNDILELEDRNPLGPEGDLRFVPLNMTTLDAAYKSTTEVPSVTTATTDQAEPDTDDATSTATAVDGAASTDVQATALNGAQIASLMQLGTALATGTMPPTGTHAMIEASFPAMPRELIDTIVNDLDAFAKTRKPEPVAAPAPAPAKAAVVDASLVINQATLATAAQSVLTSTLVGLIGYEARQAVKAATHPRTFDKWCAEFYGDKFASTFTAQVSPLLSGAAPLGVSVTPADFAASHVATSRRELLALLETPINDFAAAVQTTVDGWDVRALTEAASAFTLTKG